jgi:hypothetical protein
LAGSSATLTGVLQADKKMAADPTMESKVRERIEITSKVRFTGISSLLDGQTIRYEFIAQFITEFIANISLTSARLTQNYPNKTRQRFEVILRLSYTSAITY